MNGSSASFCTEKERMNHSCGICLALFQTRCDGIHHFDSFGILKAMSGFGGSAMPWQLVLGRALLYPFDHSSGTRILLVGICKIHPQGPNPEWIEADV